MKKYIFTILGPLSFLPAIMLLIAAFSKQPYQYYEWLRIVVCSAASLWCIMGLISANEDDSGAAVYFLFLPCTLGVLVICRELLAILC